MGIFARLIERRAVKETYANSLRDGPEWLTGSPVTTSGAAMDENAAIRIAAVWACVRAISEDLATLPLNVYENLEKRGKRKATDHRLYRVLHDSPNPFMTSVTFREALNFHRLLTGNAYAWIEYDRAGNVKAIWPLRPDMTSVERDGNVLRYTTRTEDGKAEVTFLDWEILHVPGMGWDGIRGFSPVALARESFGLTAAAHEFGARYYGNGAQPGVVLEHPARLDPDVGKRIAESWASAHQGLANSHRAAVLEEGMKVSKVGIPPDESQFIETRKFQVEEICRWFRVPPHKIASLDRATFSNIEQQSIEYVVDCLRPQAVKIEQEFNRKLFSTTSSGKYFVEHLFDGLLRGDSKTRAEAMAIGRQWGWISANDVCEIENRNPIGPQGDIYLVPANMIDADSLLEDPDPEPPPVPPANPVPDPEGTGDAAEGDAVDPEADPADPGDQAVEGDAVDAVQADAARAAFELVFLDLGSRVVRRETKRIAEASGRIVSGGIQGFDRWVNGFFDEHRRWVEGTSRGVLEAVGIVFPVSDPGATTSRIARDHVEASRGALASHVAEAGGKGLSVTIPALMRRWEEERAEEFKARLIEAVFGSRERRAA
jgi:HK97 family phage portal protein